MLVSSEFVNNTKPLVVLVMVSILLPIRSFYSGSVLWIRDAASIMDFGALTCVSLEVSS